MLFRINYKNFLIHMIDYFTREELLNIHYLIIGSTKMPHQRLSIQVVRAPADMYPTVDILNDLFTYGNEALFRKEYYRELRQSRNTLFVNIIQPILKYNHNILLIGMEYEDIHTDVITEYLEKEFNLPCTDLNRLFLEGETDIFYIDKKDVQKKTKEILQEVLQEQFKSLESSAIGREKLIGRMSKREKIKKLEELGVKVQKSDYENLDELLVEVGAWTRD